MKPMARMRMLALPFAMLSAAFLLMAGTVAAQESPAKEKGVKTKATKAAAGAKDENIKDTSTKNNPASKILPPSTKTTVRGSGPLACGVYVENHTQWKILVYIDGYPAGFVGPWGDLRVITGNGVSTAYARAEFFDGSALTWGTQVFNCSPGAIVPWALWP